MLEPSRDSSRGVHRMKHHPPLGPEVPLGLGTHRAQQSPLETELRHYKAQVFHQLDPFRLNSLLTDQHLTEIQTSCKSKQGGHQRKRGRGRDGERRGKGK